MARARERSLPARLALAGVVFFFVATLVGSALMVGGASATVEFTLLQLNDVYEIAPLSGNDQGGLARVATLRQALLRENPNTYTLLAGDLFSPSAMGNIEVDGEKLRGRQMVDVMNRVGLDFATFGNHEFDLDRKAFEQRLKESDGHFRWVSANVAYADGSPIPGVGPNLVFDVPDGSARPLRVGLFGLTIETVKPNDYVVYRRPLDVAREQVAALRGKVDVLVALTHLSIDEDREIAELAPGIDLIIGGHEHENEQIHRGPNFTPILKADANARTVYVHRLSYDTRQRSLRLVSELRVVDASVASDPAVAASVRSWQERAFAALRKQGFEPGERIATLPYELDGLEASVRNGSTALTELIGQAMLASAAPARLAIYNSGSIRIDDKLPAGPVTQYDAFRVLPFGGKLLLVEMTGDKLRTVLDIGAGNRGSGGFLQTANVQPDPMRSGWLVGGEPLQAARSYSIVINDYLLTGSETKLAMLKEDAGNLKVLQRDVGDLQSALIAQFRKTYGVR